MSERYARFVNRWKWLLIAVWAVLVAAVLILLPKLPDVVSHKSTTYLPDSDPSMVAGRLADSVDPAHSSKSTVIVAIHRNGGLTDADRAYLEEGLAKIAADRAAYHVSYVQDAKNAPKDTADSFISGDRTTEIAVVGLTENIENPSLKDDLQHLHDAFAAPPAGAQVYLTGDTPVQKDAITLMQEAADKTAVVTVALVLVILLAVFRALLAPLLTLLAVGLSYLVSSSIVAWLAERGFPVSTFTQTFMIAVLFGAGTDYTVILLNRFREELTKTHNRAEALAGALRGVGKTVVFSSLTVLVSFAALYFANFGLYRSGVGVAVGVAVTLLTCLTLIPALMAVFGRNLYWPVVPKPGMAHRPSRLWGWTSRVSTRRPWLVLAVLAIALTPVALAYGPSRSFDPMADIPNAPSVQGFHTVSRAFGTGEAMPTTVVLKTDQNLRTPDGLATIDRISRQLASVSGVAEVDSATQPLGKVITDFQLSQQNQRAADGLKQVGSGLGQMAGQLGDAARQSSSAQSALTRLQNGAASLAQGAQQTAGGAGKVAAGADQLATGAKQLASGAEQAGQAAAQLADGTQRASQAAGQLSTAASALANAIAQWTAAHPDQAANPNWQQIEQLAQQLAQGNGQMAESSRQLAQGARQLAVSMPGLVKGADQVAAGAANLAQGAHQVAGGANQLAQGGERLAGGIGQFSAGTAQLSAGFAQAADGAKKLQSGVGQAQSFLSESSRAPSPGFYVPQSEIDHNDQLRQALDAYVSPDGHLAKFRVLLNHTPYSPEAIDTVHRLRQAADAALAASPVHTGTLYIGGTTALQAAMNQLASQDFSWTMTLVFGAIFILLVVMLRSVLTPLVILVSLGATYFVTMGVVQQAAVHILHQDGVNWAVPFFTFLLLVALGVDYSIFLMSRFDEEYWAGLGSDARRGSQGASRLAPRGPMPMRAMRTAMRKMGGVVFSAALIMAGTFGSMMVTGMATMVEIGLSVVVGLFVYVFVLLAFFMPAAIALVGPAHPWPFVRWHEEDDADMDEDPETDARQPAPVRPSLEKPGSQV
ncbi:MMPL family transporter [Alicyclobacillus sp.]|uniref:MMPL family transporter n=1 Tax=Alicyclobacillus sp. TaxID=61169 RepID=UPI0025C0C823|nr:MMPL family transporter [Alicyclobacillus sp.]MCL6516975.1 MMPL family transporter [Alicyclobacillus sp.]